MVLIVFFGKSFEPATTEGRDCKTRHKIGNHRKNCSKYGRTEQHRLEQRCPDFSELHRLKCVSQMQRRRAFDIPADDKAAKLISATPDKRERQRIGKCGAQRCCSNVTGQKICQNNCNNQVKTKERCKAEKTPTASPAATACGDAVMRSTRLPPYLNERAKERRGQTSSLRRSLRVGGFRRWNNIGFSYCSLSTETIVIIVQPMRQRSYRYARSVLHQDAANRTSVIHPAYGETLS